MVPQQSAVAHLIKLRDPRATFIRLHMLRLDIHRNLCQIQIRSNPRRRRDSCRFIDIPYHCLCKLSCCHLIGIQVCRRINEHLIHRIDMHILRRDIFQVDIVNARTVFHVMCHPRLRRNIVQRQPWIRFHLQIFIRRSVKFPPRCKCQPLTVDLFYPLHNFEQARPPRYAIGFQGWRNSQTDCLICYDEVRCERVQSPLHALHRRIK